MCNFIHYICLFFKNFNSFKDKSLISEILYLATLHSAIFKKSSKTELLRTDQAHMSF